MVKNHPKYCSYFPLLLKALNRVGGDVLELGSGLHSTYFLHWFCYDHGRRLWTYENHPRYYQIAKQCEADFHKVCLVEDWAETDIERPWGVVLVDHAPAIRRKEDVRRLVDYAEVLLLHDSQGRSRKHYHYEEIYPLFRFKYTYPVIPQTIAVSNSINVGLWANG